MRLPADHAPLGIDDLEVLFPRLASIDGHQRNAGDDCDVWLAAARQGRWSRAQVGAATLALAAEFTGYRIMPGHVAERIAADRARIRERWYCPDPPRELADDPAAEMVWRRQVADDFRDRAVLALAANRPLDDVPMVVSPEMPAIAAPGGRQQVVEACGEFAGRHAIEPVRSAPPPTVRANRDPVTAAVARAELDAVRRNPPAQADE